MAGIGRVGSFAVDAPLAQNYIGQALTDTENQGFRYRKERRDIADAKKKEEEDKYKDLVTELDENDKNNKLLISGYESIDSPMQMFATDVRRKNIDWINQKNREKDPYKKAEIQLKINNSNQSIPTLNQYTKLLNSKKAELEEGIKAGKYNERDLTAVTELAKSIDSGKYKMEINENGVPRMTIYKVDEAGVPVGILEKNISLGDLTNRITPFQKPTYDINGGIAEQITSQIKLDESKVQKGFETYTVEQRNKRVDDALRNKAKEVASMPSEAYELWQKMGNAPKRTFTDADKQQIADYVEKDLKARYRNKYEKDIDQAGALNARKFAKELKDEAVIISEPSVVRSSSDNPYKLDAKDANGKTIVLQDGTKDYPIGNAIIKTGGGKEKKVTNVFVSPGGKLRVRVEESGFENSSKDKFELTESGKQKEKLAKQKAENSKKPFSTKDFYAELAPEDYKAEKISDKTPKVKILDFKDMKEIGPYALKMGYKGAPEMVEDFIQRSGGDEFIVTPDERKQAKPKSEAIQFDSEGNIIIN